MVSALRNILSIATDGQEPSLVSGGEERKSPTRMFARVTSIDAAGTPEFPALPNLRHTIRHRATCHGGLEFTGANTCLHPVSDSMGEPEPAGVPSYASRSATTTAPLKGVWQHPFYFHNGSAATLAHVVNINNTRRSLGPYARREGRPGAVPEVVVAAVPPTIWWVCSSLDSGASTWSGGTLCQAARASAQTGGQAFDPGTRGVDCSNQGNSNV